MGESKRRKSSSDMHSHPKGDPIYGEIHLFDLPPHPDINSTRIRELLGDDSIPLGVPVSLRVHRARVADREFLIGFCVGDGRSFSAVGISVIDRLLREAPNAAVHVVPISDREIAWDVVLRHLRTFNGKVLVFAFSDSHVYDGGAPEVFYSKYIVNHDENGQVRPQLSQAQRRKVMERAAAIYGTTPPPKFYEMPGVDPQEPPWIFEMLGTEGRSIRLTVWNGRRDFIHEISEDVLQLVGGKRIAVVQVGSPVGVNGRSSIALSRHFAGEFDGIVHWARDTATYMSILREFVLANLTSIPAPDLPSDWTPEVVIMPVNDALDEEPGSADCGKPPQMEPKEIAPTFQELYGLLLSGAALDREFWTARMIERAEKYYMGSHLKLPADTIKAGEKMLKKGLFRLPSHEMVFEYDTRDQFFERLVLLCWQSDEPTGDASGLILCTPLLRHNGKWTSWIVTLAFSYEGEYRVDIDATISREEKQFVDELMSMAYCLLLGSVVALETGTAVIRKVFPKRNAGSKIDREANLQSLPYFRVEWS